MTTTQKRRIVQRSKLVDDLWFLVNPMYNGHSMSDFTVVLEYLLPVSRKYKSEILSLSDSDYNGYLKYTLPFDTELTSEAGSIELMLSFILSKLDEEGKSVQRVRKVTGTTLIIVPITAWSDIIPDSALSALDQRIIKTDAQIRALSEISNALYVSKADDIMYDESSNELQLTAAGKEIGRKIVLAGAGQSLKDGIPVIDLDNMNKDDTVVEEEDNIVEF
jgi:hypothetical protein